MSAKNETVLSPAHAAMPRSNQLQPRSLRLRLVLWYSALLTVAIVLFAILVWSLTTDALNQSVESSVRAEARVVTSALNRELSATEPHWPDHIVLQSVNTYQEPGTVVEVVDAKRTQRYDSDQNPATSIPVSAETIRTTLSGQTIWYTADIENEKVRVEALPIRAPNISSQVGPVIGTLLVAKSLGEVNATLLLLRTLLLLTGLAVVGGTLLGGWAIAARVLYPLAEIAKTARSITATTAHGTRLGNLSQRVPGPGGRDEMAQVVATFNEMLADLDRATQAQRRFVADASHELRAPLTTIQGNLALLQRHVDELPREEVHTMLADAHAETLRLAQLVEELLLLARADASMDQSSVTVEKERSIGKVLRPQPVELDHTVLQLVRQFRGRLRVEDAKLEVGSIEPVRVRGDEESIRRVLLILLDNALKYTSTNEMDRTNRVIVSVEREEQEGVLRVRDTGIGIDSNDLLHIFERFYRADRARSRQGTGLGLSIAQALVEQSGGHIDAESTPGQGSTFTVRLPLS